MCLCSTHRKRESVVSTVPESSCSKGRSNGCLNLQSRASGADAQDSKMLYYLNFACKYLTFAFYVTTLT